MNETRYRYVLSDPHGCQDVLERAIAAIDLTEDDCLYLLGDYIPHQSFGMDNDGFFALCGKSLAYVRSLQRRLGERICVLCGNHELALLDWADAGMIELSAPMERWLRSLPAVVENDRQIFVHAGIDEEAGPWWRLGYEDWYFCSKFPAAFGRYDKDIIAGHVGAPGLAGDDGFEGAYWDGESHYYIDGSTELTGRITVLRYSVERGSYDQRIVTAQGVSPWMPIEASA